MSAAGIVSRSGKPLSHNIALSNVSRCDLSTAPDSVGENPRPGSPALEGSPSYSKTTKAEIARDGGEITPESSQQFHPGNHPRQPPAGCAGGNSSHSLRLLYMNLRLFLLVFIT
jgi:hypothetical protein